MDPIFVYITIENTKEAKKLCAMLIEEKLIACANIFPIESMYVWKDKLVEDKEAVIIAKTFDEKYNSLIKFVESHHSYEIPCITKFYVEPNKEFLNWMTGEVES